LSWIQNGNSVDFVQQLKCRFNEPSPAEKMLILSTRQKADFLDIVQQTKSIFIACYFNSYVVTIKGAMNSHEKP